MKDDKIEFDLEQFLIDNNLKNELEPYNYNQYKEINPKLSLRMYKHLRENGTLWKVICGFRNEISYPTEVLERDMSKFNNTNYRNRYSLLP